MASRIKAPLEVEVSVYGYAGRAVTSDTGDPEVSIQPSVNLIKPFAFKDLSSLEIQTI